MTVPPPGDPYTPTPSPELPGPPAPAATATAAPYPPGGGPTGPASGFGAPPAPTDGVSIAALVTGLLGTALLAVGLGIAGIVRTSAGRRRGRGLAIAGLVLGILSTLVWGAIVVGAVFVASNQEAFSDALEESFDEVYQEQTGTDLAIGECFEPPADLTSGDPLVAVECGLPHSSEVVGVIDLPDGAFPGQQAMVDQAESTCLDVFETYVGAPYEESTLALVYFHPTEASWTLGDRRILCGAEAYGEPLTGSVAGSGL